VPAIGISAFAHSLPKVHVSPAPVRSAHDFPSAWQSLPHCIMPFTRIWVMIVPGVGIYTEKAAKQPCETPKFGFPNL
jgi:hypothetical protein